ncbi:MAG: hypothetical protein Q8P41_31075 [Pseudomonadota bacterium]|nr:hypothetical protein [Pseudomonadota bacterium]
MSFLATALASASLAHAGLHAELDRELAGAPDLAVACSSADTALVRVQQAAAIFGAARGKARGTARVEAPGEMPGEAPADAPGDAGTLGTDDDLLRFVDGVRATFAPDARLAISWWEASETVRLGFDTTLTAPALAQRFVELDPAAKGEVFEGPAGWAVREGDGDELLVEVSEGWARVTRGPASALPPRTVRANLLAAIPETPGCVLSVHVADDEIGEVDVAAHLSFIEGQPATFAVSLPGLKASDAILLEGAVPPTVRTPERPQAVVVIGIGLDSIDFSTFLAGKELRAARRLQNLFPVTGGTTVALLQMEPAPRLAAVIPLAGRMPARKVARRTRRLAKLADLEVLRVDATHLSFTIGDIEILAAARDNRLELSTDPGTLNTMQYDVRSGEPWVSGTVAELAASWPLVVASSILPGADGAPARVLPRPLYLALDLEDALLKGVIDVPLPLAEMAALAEQVDEARKAADASGPDGD